VSVSPRVTEKAIEKAPLWEMRRAQNLEKM
jgi:hypothetical protein